MIKLKVNEIALNRVFVHTVLNIKALNDSDLFVFCQS